VSIDIGSVNRTQHPRIQYLLWFSTAPEIVDTVEGLIEGAKNILVILDSDNNWENRLNELNCYSKFVPKNKYYH